MNFSNIDFLNIKGSDYRCIISLISKNEAINLIQNVDLTEKKQIIIKHKNLLSHIKTGKEILTFDNIEIERNKFYRNKTPVFLKDVDIEKVLVSKHFMSTLHIMIPKTSAYLKKVMMDKLNGCIF